MNPLLVTLRISVLAVALILNPIASTLSVAEEGATQPAAAGQNNPTPQIPFEGMAFSAEGQEEIQKGFEAAKAEIDAFKAANPGVEPVVAIQRTDNGGMLRAWAESAYYKATFSIIRGFGFVGPTVALGAAAGVAKTAGVSVLVVIIGLNHAAWELFVAGGVMAIVAAVYQYFNKQLEDFLTTHRLSKWFKTEAGSRSETVANTVDEVGRWYALDVVYSGILFLLLRKLGLSSPDPSFPDLALLAMNSAIGTIGGAGFDLSFAEERNRENRLNPANEKWHQFKADRRLVWLSGWVSLWQTVDYASGGWGKILANVVLVGVTGTLGAIRYYKQKQITLQTFGCSKEFETPPALPSPTVANAAAAGN